MCPWERLVAAVNHPCRRLYHFVIAGGRAKEAQSTGCEEYDRTSDAPLDHGGTRARPLLDAVRERVVHCLPGPSYHSERLASKDHLVRLSSFGVVHHQEKREPGLGVRRFATSGVGKHF